MGNCRMEGRGGGEILQCIFWARHFCVGGLVSILLVYRNIPEEE